MSDIIDMLHDAQRLIGECIEEDKRSLILDGLTLSSEAISTAVGRIENQRRKIDELETKNQALEEKLRGEKGKSMKAKKVIKKLEKAEELLDELLERSENMNMLTDDAAEDAMEEFCEAVLSIRVAVMDAIDKLEEQKEKIRRLKAESRNYESV